MSVTIPRQMLNLRDLEVAIHADNTAYTFFMIGYEKKVPALLSQIDEETSKLNAIVSKLVRIDPKLVGQARFSENANRITKSFKNAAWKVTHFFTKIFHSKFLNEQKETYQNCKDSLNVLRSELKQQIQLKHDLESRLAERCRMAQTMDELGFHEPLVVIKPKQEEPKQEATGCLKRLRNWFK